MVLEQTGLSLLEIWGGQVNGVKRGSNPRPRVSSGNSGVVTNRSYCRLWAILVALLGWACGSSRSRLPCLLSSWIETKRLSKRPVWSHRSGYKIDDMGSG